VQVIVEGAFETGGERLVDVVSKILSHHVGNSDGKECAVQAFGIGEPIEYAH
jgi:hypothetical protein